MKLFFKAESTKKTRTFSKGNVFLGQTYQLHNGALKSNDVDVILFIHTRSQVSDCYTNHLHEHSQMHEDDKERHSIKPFCLQLHLNSG